jgi:hypothetical protein
MVATYGQGNVQILATNRMTLKKTTQAAQDFITNYHSLVISSQVRAATLPTAIHTHIQILITTWTNLSRLKDSMFNEVCCARPCQETKLIC